MILKDLLPAGGTTISGGSQLLIGKLGTICVHVTKKLYGSDGTGTIDTVLVIKL